MMFIWLSHQRYLLFGILLIVLQTRVLTTIQLHTSTISPLDTTPVLAVEGHQSFFPCDLTPPNPDEAVYLVLWYKEDQGEPLYSYDARNSAWNLGARWSDEFQFGSRAYFELSSSPAKMRVENIQKNEAGIYRCRVDFKSAPTRNSLVNVSLIEPPTSTTIIDFRGQEVKTIAGPYQKDSIVTLTCVSSGGDPSPQVTWWKENELIDQSYEKTYQHVVQNTIKIGPLLRSDLGTVLTCLSSNNNISVPVSSRVTIDMVFPAIDISITTIGQPLSAGTVYIMSCEAAGSRPDPVISWWLGSEELIDEEQLLEKIKDIVKSTIYFTPSTQDHGKVLVCRAENPHIIDSGIEDSWTLTVYYPPRLNLSFGLSMNAELIDEGKDVYFMCEIKANPEVYKIGWRHGNQSLVQDLDKGILITDTSLVLQKVKRTQSGNYTCVASNLEGDAESNPLNVQIMYAPRCQFETKSSVGANIGSNLSVLCRVDSFPEPSSFTWSFNNSKESYEVSSDKFTVNRTTSIVKHSLLSDHNFGHLYCLASNSKGVMRDPCVFHIIPARPPSAPLDCVVLNQTTDLLQVECQPGFDGGLDQMFLLEVVDVANSIILANVSSTRPQFTITGLNPGRDLRLVVYAENRNGKSSIITLEGFTTKVAQLQIESPVPLQFTPFLGILAGIVLTLLIIILAIILVIRLKYKYGKRCPGNSINSDGDQDANYRSFKFENNPNRISGRITPESDSEWTQPIDKSDTKCAEQHNPKLYQQDANSSYSSDSLRPNIIVNHCEKDHSWTPFLHEHSQESII